MPAGTTPHPLPPRMDPVAAVEFDLLNASGVATTIFLCSTGKASVVRIVAGTKVQYLPLLTGMPILIGSTINVTQYGSPVRAQPNAGVIQFRLDEAIWPWVQYHWIGRVFRIYEGNRPPLSAMVDVDQDMVLVYVGRVAGLAHDTIVATVETTDASLDLDNPIVTNFYDITFPVGLQGKPKPTARGQFFSAEPNIVNETAQTYEVQSLAIGLKSVDAVRVGGVPWDEKAFPPSPGEWSPETIGGVIQRIDLGSPPEGQDVRVDGNAGNTTLGQLITAVVLDGGGKVDAAAMAALDVATQGQQASLVTSTTPLNRLNALDDPVTAGGCWWGMNPLEQATAAAIAVPDPVGKYILTDVEINTISLNTIQPLAWRIRVGSQRNWSPESSFDDAVLQTDITKLSAPALVYEPHYENPNALLLEPRAVDVPLLAGTSPAPIDAANEQARLIAAWGGNRVVLDCTAWMRPEEINLYDTVEVDFRVFTGTYRIVSAIRAIGGNGPATLQLWGTLGDVPPAPIPLPLPPGVTQPGGGGGTGGGGTGVGTGSPPPAQTGWVFSIFMNGTAPIHDDGAIWFFDSSLGTTFQFPGGWIETQIGVLGSSYSPFSIAQTLAGNLTKPPFGTPVEGFAGKSGLTVTFVSGDTALAVPGTAHFIVKQVPFTGTVSVPTPIIAPAPGGLPGSGSIPNPAGVAGSYSITVDPYFG